jgi:abortive infection bacteriophage resistance protein
MFGWKSGKEVSITETFHVEEPEIKFAQKAGPMAHKPDDVIEKKAMRATQDNEDIHTEKIRHRRYQNFLSGVVCDVYGRLYRDDGRSGD